MHASLQTGAGERSGTNASRTGWALSGLVILFLMLDGAMKVAQLPVVAETSAQLGWPSDPATTYLPPACCSDRPCSTRFRAPRCSARSC